MFDGIARRYDLLNRVMSLGLDARWRRRQVELCAVGPGARCLDLCCGTGDVARELARRGAATVGLDASAGMLAVARQRMGEKIALVRGDALRLPFPDDLFDAVTIAFGNRNVASLPALYAEMRRVAKPGGRIVSLEINRPAAPWLQWAFLLYFSRLPALFARLLGSDPSAYEYLPESVRRYPDPDAVAAIMRDAGLRDVRVFRHLGGIIVLHVGIG
jgi:demethylmenaquinone methyltransferase/2-methoxy-6-polyprenyl-1,4-benzoquinol methylase